MHVFERFKNVGVSLLVASHDAALVSSLHYRTLILDHGQLVHDRPESNHARLSVYLPDAIPEAEGRQVSEDLLLRDDVQAMSFISSDQEPDEVQPRLRAWRYFVTAATQSIAGGHSGYPHCRGS